MQEKLRAYAEAGATGIAAQIFPVGPDHEASIRRSRELLESLVGKI